MREHLYAEAYARMTGSLKRQGIQLRVITKYDRLDRIIQDLQKPYLTPALSPFLNDFSPGNCFWLIAEKDGDPVAAGGTRFDDLAEDPISEFWRRSAERHYGRVDGRNPVTINPIVDRKIGGKVAYFGDLICKPGAGSLKTLEHFVRAGQMLTCLKWNPDYNYAWLRTRDTRRGAHVRYGFATCMPNSQRWHKPPEIRSNLEACCYSSRDDLRLLAEEILDDGSSLQ